jgi:hypothetical protein
MDIFEQPEVVPLHLAVPYPLFEALQAEGLRQLRSPGQIAAQVLAWALPGYVREQVAETLAPPRVVEAAVRAPKRSKAAVA